MIATTTTVEPAYLSVVELARYLGVSRRTAYALVNQRAVPFVRIGGQYRIPRIDLERQLAEQARK